MTAQTLFYIVLGILTINFIKDKILNALNARHYNDPIPIELDDVYDEEANKLWDDFKKRMMVKIFPEGSYDKRFFLNKQNPFYRLCICYKDIWDFFWNYHNNLRRKFLIIVVKDNWEINIIMSYCPL